MTNAGLFFSKLVRGLTYFGKTLQNLLSNQQSTFCNYIGDWAFIDEHGNVFCCPYCRPFLIGNIYKSSLSKIWKSGIRLKIARFLSEHKLLYCYYGCFIIKVSAADFLKLSVKNNLSHPRVLTIRFGTACNLNCTMCTLNHHSKTLLKSDFLKKNVNWNLVDKIGIEGGEITYINEAIDFCKWLFYEKKKRLSQLTTNGLLLADDLAHLFVKNTDQITISVNATNEETYDKIVRGSDFKMLIDNIKNLINLKRLHNLKTKIIFHFTIVPENFHELVRAIEFANKLECDYITFTYDATTMPSFLKKNSVLKNKIYGELIHAIKRTNWRFDLNFSCNAPILSDLFKAKIF